jgi:imidazolonepropionase-like amidohydrolase
MKAPLIKTMRLTLALLFLLLCLSSPAAAQTSPDTRGRPVVFNNVTVIDMTGAPPRAGMTVVVAGERVAAVGRPGEVAVPPGAQVVDATGKFLLPGLWDMHAHLNWERDGDVEKTLLPLHVATGVTGVRDLWNLHALDGMGRINKWRAAIKSGELAGPRIEAVAKGIDGPAGGTAYIRVKDAAEAREAVRKIKRQGYDFLKVYSNLSRESFFAAVDEARRLGLPFAGHVPFAVSASEAADAGLRSIEHLSETIIGSASNEAELRREMLDFLARVEALKGKSMTPALDEESRRVTTRQMDAYDAGTEARLFARFVERGTYHCPTLVIYRMWASASEAEWPRDARLRYVPARQRRRDQAGLDAMKAWGAAESALRKRLYEVRLRQTGAMHRAGVLLLAGTDAAGAYPVHGFSLHDELELLVRAGLSPFDALRAATFNPAKYFGRLDSLGTVEPGKLADLLLLDADPLADIRNTRRIHAVVAGGRYFSKESLEKILAGAEAKSKDEG